MKARSGAFLGFFLGGFVGAFLGVWRVFPGLRF